VEVAATVRWSSIEGGFWRLDTDGGAHFDAHDLSIEFQKDGLRVAVRLVPALNQMSAHMACLIVDITTIRDLSVEVVGVVRWNDFEGGFWTIHADGGARYDTHNLPAEFRQDGLRVAAKLVPLPDQVCIHMSGAIMDATSIRRL
jgi:hypothetical protein